jgi:SAM-dependent methyltransferase
MPPLHDDRSLETWLAALDERHLAGLTLSEVARALRALSSCYVERRAKLQTGGALDTAGKRAAFALFYAPVHFLVTRHIVRALGDSGLTVERITDLGCGTGAAGAAWALEAGQRSLAPEGRHGSAGGVRLTGIDRHPWAVAEANWTYRTLGIRGRATQGDIGRTPFHVRPGTGLIAAYTLNEVPGEVRHRVLAQLVGAYERGARVLVVEPIARRMAAWWNEWADRVSARGGRSDEWRFAAELPERQRALARAAGLDPRDLTARSLFLAPEGSSGKNSASSAQSTA